MVEPAPRGPRCGDLLHVTRDASVQFVRPLLFRVIRVHEDWHTYHGWLWLDGYEVDARGDAVARRSIYVRPAGLRWLTRAPRPSATPSERSRPARRPA
ncbi:hypothetical protein E1258_22480 [Micromonospora sp. KC207]|uniref:hypothetical protein n=1 Tax=Micromonospora sp. KC207 TaxID=2530377 RepID=UPI001043B32F|nr:hypothetical protein [Micromonospora sp. KC207]TDC57213.1 hypothetical protein E1258_22480 [Micromonospora sp. KC207]